MSTEAKSGQLVVWITRIAGLWILAGALFKLFLGTPADLPRLVRELPLELGVTYRVAIAAELAVALLALLKPRSAWLLLIVLLLLFGVMLVAQIQAEEPSCGCFGSEVIIPPAVMLGIDGTLLLLLLLGRPWSTMGRDAANVLAVVVLLAVALPLPWLLDREVKDGADAATDGPGPAYTVLDVRTWAGSRLADTPLAKWVKLDDLPSDALWVLWRKSCDVCPLLLSWLKDLDITRRPLVLLELPEDLEEGVEAHVHDLPDDPDTTRRALPDDRDWLLETPGILVVRGGCVVVAADGVALDAFQRLDEQPTVECE